MNTDPYDVRIAEPDEHYHADVEYLSNSLIELWRGDPRDFVDQAILHIRKRKVTDEMVLGSFVEALVFRDPEDVWRDFIVIREHEEKPGKPMHRAGKKWQAFKAEAGRREMLTPAYAELASHMVEALAAHPVAAPLLIKGQGIDQPSLRWTCPETGVRMRGKPERIFVGERLCIELKTDLDPRPTRDSLRRWDERGYYRKLAGYLDGLKAIYGHPFKGYIIYVANSPRPRVCVQEFPFDAPVMNIARDEYQESVLEIDACRRANEWRERFEVEAVLGEPVEWKLREYERAEREPVMLTGARRVEVANG